MYELIKTITSILWASQNFILHQTIITENRKFSQGQYFYECINIEENYFLSKNLDDFNINKV